MQPGTPGGRPFEAPTPGNGWSAQTPGASFSEAGTPTEPVQSYGNSTLNIIEAENFPFVAFCLVLFLAVTVLYLECYNYGMKRWQAFSSISCFLCIFDASAYYELFVWQPLQALICQVHLEALL